MHVSLPYRSLTGDVCTSFGLQTCVFAGRLVGNCEEFAEDIAPEIVINKRMKMFFKVRKWSCLGGSVG